MQCVRFASADKSLHRSPGGSSGKLAHQGRSCDVANRPYDTLLPTVHTSRTYRHRREMKDLLPRYPVTVFLGLEPRPQLGSVLILVLGLFVAFATPETGSAAQLTPTDKAVVTLHSAKTEPAPGTDLPITAFLTIENGWHTNSNQPSFPYLIATEANFILPTEWTLRDLQYPAGEMKTFAFADQPLSVFEGEIAIRAIAEISGSALGTYPIEADVTYQACNDRSCLAPVTTHASLNIRVATSAEGSAEITKPEPDPEVSTAAVVPPAISTSAPAAAVTSGLGLILLFGWLGGLILNAMPCVLPIVSLKVFGLVKSASQGRAAVTAGALATSLGILISFWLLALAAILAKGAGASVGWGIQFQNPTFVFFLSAIVVLFALNLWGIFEISLPRVASRFAGGGPREGIAGHLASGHGITYRVRVSRVHS